MISCAGPLPEPSAQATRALVSAARPGALPPSSLVTRILPVRSPYSRRCPHPGPDIPRSGPCHPGFTQGRLGPLSHAEALVCFNSLAMPAYSPRISVASPTGQQWRIGHGRQEVIVCEVGATLRAYSVGQMAVLDGFGADEWSHSGRGQVLAPWPNRLADGRYEFNGVRAQAALDEPERRNAIHGLVRWMPWTLQTRHQNQLSLRLQLHPSPGYPFSLLLEIDYHVGREGLTVTTRAQSLEESEIPFGIGFHPYLTAGGGAGTGTNTNTNTIDGAILQVPAHHTLDTDDRGLPTGTLTPVEGTDRDFTTARFIGPVVLDTGYTTLDRDAEGVARASLEAPGGVGGVTLWGDAGFPYLMVYTGDALGEVQRRRHAVAIEPMTCPPNAFRTGDDVLALEPGREWTARWGIEPQ